MVDRKGCIQTMIIAGIWLGSPFVFSIIMPLVSGCDKGLSIFLNFIIPDLSLIASAFVITGLTFIKELFAFIASLFKKQKEVVEHHEERVVPLSFGWSAIPTSTIIFTLAGVLAPLFANPISISVISAYAIAGFIWGFILYILLVSYCQEE